MSSHQHQAFFILVPESGSNSTSSQGSDEHTFTLATVNSIGDAKRLAKELSSQGVSTIELSSRFGDDGLAAIREVAGENVRVGLVRF